MNYTGNDGNAVFPLGLQLQGGVVGQTVQLDGGVWGSVWWSQDSFPLAFPSRDFPIVPLWRTTFC